MCRAQKLPYTIGAATVLVCPALEVIVNKKADNSKQESFDTFFHDVNIYRVHRKESINYEYLKNRLKITLKKNVLKGEIIETVPILFWPSLFVDNTIGHENYLSLG